MYTGHTLNYPKQENPKGVSGQVLVSESRALVSESRGLVSEPLVSES